MLKKRYGLALISILLFCVVNEKYSILVIPSTVSMANFQFNIFTISSVFAGFSFTVLGILLGMSSEQLVIKLRDTSIIAKKSERIVISIIFFCSSGMISLFFAIGFNEGISKIVNHAINIELSHIWNVIYIYGIGFLFFGIMYFLKSIMDIYELIKKVYEYNKKQYSEKSNKFNNSMKKAKDKLNNN